MSEIGNIIDDPLKKKKITTPKLLDEAADATRNLNLGDTDPEERQRIFDYRAKPALDLFEKQQQTTNKVFQSQGLRFSSERRDQALTDTENTFRYIGESVMIPQIEREQADLRANIGLQANIGAQQESLDLQSRGMAVQEGQLALSDRIQTGQLKLAEGQLDVQERQQTMQEVNSAMERALAQGDATGTFVDPVTGMSMDTLKKAAQDFGQSIEERQTTVLELDAAEQRAQAHGEATGVYTDPVTGLDSETLQAKRDKLNARVQRAIQIGAWIEDDLDLDLANVFAILGIDPDEFLGEGGDGGAPGDGEEPGDNIDDIVDSVWDTEKEITFISQLGTILDGWGLASDEAARDALEAVTAELGVDAAQELFSRFSAGDPITLQELWELDAEVFYMLGDMLVVDMQGGSLDPATTTLRIPGANGTPTSVDDGANQTNVDDFGQYDLGSIGDIIDQYNVDGSITLEQWESLPSNLQGGIQKPDATTATPAASFENDVLSATGSSYTSDQINNAKRLYRSSGAQAAQDYLRGFDRTTTTNNTNTNIGDDDGGDTGSQGTSSNPIDFAKSLKIGDGSKVNSTGDSRIADLERMVSDGRLDHDALHMLFNQGKINNTVLHHLKSAGGF